MVENENGEPGILGNFDRCRLLVVEKGFFLDDETKTLLREFGALIERVDGERGAASHRLGTFDAAIIDISLNADESFAWARRLDEFDVAYVFATNLRENNSDERFRPFRLCANPRELEFIARSLFGEERIN